MLSNCMTSKKVQLQRFAPAWSSLTYEIPNGKYHLVQLLKIPLGSVNGSRQFSENYVLSLTNKWCGEITELFLIAKTHPEAA